MGNASPRDKDNPGVFTSLLQQRDGLNNNIGQDNGGGTFMSLPNALLPVIPRVENNQLEVPQADFMMQNSLPDPRMGAIPRNTSSNHLRTSSFSDVPFPGVNMSGAPHYSNQDLMLMAHNARNQAGFSSSTSQPIDRNFMIRGNAAGGYQAVRQAGEARVSYVNRPQTNEDFGTLEGNSNVQQAAGTFSSPGHNLDAGIPSFQTNAGEFLNPEHNANGQTLSINDYEVVGSANSGADSNPFHVMQRPQYSMQQYIPTPGGRNLSSVSNSNIGYTNLENRTLQNNHPGSSGSLGSNLAKFHNYRQVDLPWPVSETGNPILIPSLRPLDMRSLYDLSSQRAADSAMKSSSLALGGSSIRSNHAGSSITGLEYGGSHAAQNSRIPQNASAQSLGKQYQPSSTRPNLLPNNLRAILPIGFPNGAMRTQYPTNLRGPSFATGHGSPVATSHRRPTLKRSAMWSPQAPRWVQRQKIGPSTIVHPSQPNPTIGVPPIGETAPTISSIKGEGGDGPAEGTGEKCYICKRDLSENRAEVRPIVAVLPCGHAFHDECLQKITPEDQSKEPPCIPCAVNEK